MKSKGKNYKKVGKTVYLTNCSAKGKIVILNGDLEHALIFAKGQHDTSFIPSLDPQIITPEQRREVVDAFT